MFLDAFCVCCVCFYVGFFLSSFLLRGVGVGGVLGLLLFFVWFCRGGGGYGFCMRRERGIKFPTVLSFTSYQHNTSKQIS